MKDDKSTVRSLGDQLRAEYQKLLEGESADYEAIGRFIAEFSQLEMWIRTVLAATLKLDYKYFHIVTAPYDFAMLCTVAQKALSVNHPSSKKKIKEVFNECRALNDERLRVAHGTWTPILGRVLATHVSRRQLQPNVYYKNQKKLHGLAQEARRLAQAVLALPR